MANLLTVQGPAISIGTMIKAVGPPDSTWKLCNGDILLKADYHGYVANVVDLHPLMWKDWQFIDVDQATVGTIRYAIDRMGSTIVVVGVNAWVSTNGGITWSTTTNLPTSSYRVIKNNGTRFVTLKYNSAYAYHSTDGSTWTEVALPISKNWTMLSYANGTFVGMSDDGLAPYVYSSDGINWYQGTRPFTGYGIPFLISDGSKHIMLAEDYGYTNFGRIYTSTDGQNWSGGSLDFHQGSPDYSVSSPTMCYTNGEYFLFWDDYPYLRSCHRFEGSDIKNPNHWQRYMLQPTNAIRYWKAKDIIYTGNHYIIPTFLSGYDGFLVGPSLENLNYYRSQMGFVQGIVNDGENYAVCIPHTSGYRVVGRCTGVPYDTSTHFQLPFEVVVDDAGIFTYIKME